MIAEYGHMALIVALCLSIAQAIVPMVGSFVGYRTWMRLGHSLALGQLVFVAISFACLTAAFLQDDFSLQYVANNSNTLLPAQFKVSAVWGAHEGSLLLWALILALWSAAVALFSSHLPLVLSSRVLSILGAISVGFGLFILLTSNPFARILPFSPTEGGDLNPLLQDFGLIVHPPMLYMGYVGFSVAFAFAVAALIGGQFDSAWARWARPWINSAWVFLTIGITLGGKCFADALAGGNCAGTQYFSYGKARCLPQLDIAAGYFGFLSEPFGYFLGALGGVDLGARFCQ
jgi:cytochrome c-type biogenesis protein CcmF